MKDAPSVMALYDGRETHMVVVSGEFALEAELELLDDSCNHSSDLQVCELEPNQPLT